MRGWPAGAFLLFAGALLSKGMSVTLPAVLLILDVYPLRRVGLAVESGRLRIVGQARRVLLEKVPFLLASLLISLMAVYGVREVGAASAMDELNLVQRVMAS